MKRYIVSMKTIQQIIKTKTGTTIIKKYSGLCFTLGDSKKITGHSPFQKIQFTFCIAKK